MHRHTATRPSSRRTSSCAGRTGGTSTTRSRRRTPPGRWPTPTSRGSRRAAVRARHVPVPVGAGLHVGHPLGFIGTDVYARFKRMTGHNVLHTMGFDAFGLPAEQYAVQTGQHPAVTTEENIANIAASCAASAWATTRAAACPPPTPSTTAGRSGSSCRSSTPGTTPTADTARPIAELVAEFESGTRPTPDGRPWAELSSGERADISTITAWPTSARRR